MKKKLGVGESMTVYIPTPGLFVANWIATVVLAILIVAHLFQAH